MERQPDALAEGRRIYLGNILYSVKPHDIEQTLADNGFGDFVQIHLSVDPVSGRNPGYCFVDFEERATAENALSSLSASIRGRPLKVGPCRPRQERRAGNWSRDGARSGNRDGIESQTSSNFQRWGDWKRSDAVQDGSQADEGKATQGPSAALDHFNAIFERKEGKRLYIGGLGKVVDSDENYEEMRTLLADFKPTAIGKRVTAHQSNWQKPGNHNYCFVDFATEKEAEEALNALNGKPHNGDNLRVSYARGHPDRPKYQDTRYASRDRDPEARHAPRTTTPGESTPPRTFRKEYGASSGRALEASSWRRKD